jgi:hypothetical protein
MSSFGSVLRRHRRAAAVASVALAGVIVFGLYWFQPYKLFIDDRVDEALPGGSRGSAMSDSGASTREAFTTLAAGMFRSLAHESSGRALIVELGDGSRLLRFEDLAVENGPDLRVYLSTAPAGSEEDAFAGEGSFVDLGALKGNLGNQNYELPDGVDPSMYRSVVVWCRRFSVGFAVAPLDPVGEGTG